MVRDVINLTNEAGIGFVNYDRQTIDGVELQARLDTGRFFLNLGAAIIWFALHAARHKPILMAGR